MWRPYLPAVVCLVWAVERALYGPSLSPIFLVLLGVALIAMAHALGKRYGGE